MKTLVTGLFLLGLTITLYAQDPKPIELEEVVLVNTNYKYLNSTDAEDLPIPVNELQIQAATFDIKTLDIYADEYDYYEVYFIIPEGKILATYDNVGNIMRTIERYSDVKLPKPIQQSVAKRFPSWQVTKDIYLVQYREDGGDAKKVYKLTLVNGDKRIKVKLNDQGTFI